MKHTSPRTLGAKALKQALRAVRPTPSCPQPSLHSVAAAARAGQPSMAAQTQVSEQRLDWMLATLLEKITERGGSVSNRVKTLLTRFDLDNSGELEMDEFRSCLEDFLAGLQDCEFEALAQRFDSDGSGSVSIPEFTAELKRLAQEKEENGGFPPARPPPSQKTTSTRRPRACGLRKTDPSEFEGYGDGVSFSGNSKAPTPTAALDVFFDELRAKAKTLALQSSLREDGIDRKLLQRSLERQRSTPSASHLTAAQFEVALAPFGGVFDEENCLPARVWAACNNGNIEDIMSRFKKGNALRARNDVPREVMKLRTLLLDKFVGISAEINQCVRLAWRYYLLFWLPRRSARVLGVLARGILGLFTQTFDFRTGGHGRAPATGCQRPAHEIRRRRERRIRSRGMRQSFLRPRARHRGGAGQFVGRRHRRGRVANFNCGRDRGVFVGGSNGAGSPIHLIGAEAEEALLHGGGGAGAVGT